MHNGLTAPLRSYPAIMNLVFVVAAWAAQNDILLKPGQDLGHDAVIFQNTNNFVIIAD